MANEYLKRTPTSTGNRKTWTWSGWVKINKDFGSGIYNTVWSVAAGASANNSDRFHLYHYSDGRWVTTGTSSFSAVFTGPGGSAAHSRDPGAWMHICLSVNTTASNLIKDKYQRFWINGVEYNYDDAGNIADNANLAINGLYEHYIGNRDSNVTRTFDGQMTDLYLVDGQALTPDVFGFYKDGKGYISAGSSQVTDFRPGQWVPHSPRRIKSEINRRGGFGVNGYYLPMNDSSNPGADFHCDPNSIIKLKGEDLPQPRNGAPEMTDVYVSQLRTDPYAANLVLAVPGISTATGSNLITNGTFDSNVSNWTATDSTTAWENGQLKITRTAGGGLTANQAFTTETGKRYTISGTINSSTSRGDLRVYNGSGTGGSMIINISGTNGAVTDLTGSFTATSTTSTVVIAIDNNNGIVYVDNIVVKQEDAPRDYSADIKGSGSNKTVTALGSAGVGYELGGYYNSAISTSGGANRLTFPAGSDFAYGTGDFTVEGWGYPTGGNDGTYPANYLYSQAVGGQNYFVINFGNNTNTAAGNIAFTMGTGGAGGGGGCAISATGIIPINQWTHFAVVRDGTTVTVYVNGVAVGAATGVTFDLNNTTFVPTLGAYTHTSGSNFFYNGYIQDFRIYKGVAKYKGGFDVPKPYTPVGMATWRAVPDTTANNFATLNPLYTHTSSNTYSNGNLKAIATANDQVTTGNMAFSSGKWYWETRIYNDEMIGLGIPSQSINLYPGRNANAFSYHRSGSVYYNQTTINYGAGWSYNTYHVIGIAIDWTNKRAYWHVDGVWANSADPSAGTGFYDITTNASNVAASVDAVPAWRTRSASASEQVSVNFGQNPSFGGELTAGTFTDSNGKGLFKYEPPAGFLALCEDNLPAPTIRNPGEHFKTVLYTGDDNIGRSITGVGFTPDLVWIKGRSGAGDHGLWDSVRGGSLRLRSNSTGAEASNTGIISLSNDGFSLGNTGYNYGGGGGGTPASYVAWCWKAGEGNTVTNTDGSITSQVSVNQDAGFSIVSWTAANPDGRNTLGHGLGKTPKFIIAKSRTSGVDHWVCYHNSLGKDKYILLSSTAGPGSSSNYWSTAEPDSATFGVVEGISSSNNTGNMIAYCWAEIEGFSKFGSYVGNASADGSFIYCGFKPAFVITKRTDGTSNWLIHDSSRDPVNPVMKALYTNSSDAEGSAVRVDFLSNGFKHRNADGGAANNYANNYIFVAFAESPFQTANAK